jgi:hypothetical protein
MYVEEGGVTLRMGHWLVVADVRCWMSRTIHATYRFMNHKYLRERKSLAVMGKKVFLHDSISVYIESSHRLKPIVQPVREQVKQPLQPEKQKRPYDGR